MPDRNQSNSHYASLGASLRRGLGTAGFRLRLTTELSAGFLAARPAFRPEATGELPTSSPVIVSN